MLCGLLVTWDRPIVFARDVAARLLPVRWRQRVLTLMDGWPALLAATRARRASVIAMSFVLWLCHLLQVWSFTIALRSHVPLLGIPFMKPYADMAAEAARGIRHGYRGA